MTHDKIVRIIMARKKVTKRNIGKQLGIKYEDAYFDRIYRKNVTFTLFLRLLDLLDYELVFRPKGENLPEYSYRMTWDDYEGLPD